MLITIEKFPWIVKMFLIHQTLIRSNIIINYVIDEELPVLYCIGNIIKDSKFNSSALPEKSNSSRFIIYAEEHIRHYFSLNNKTGDIFQNHRLDRETVCESYLFAGSCKFKFLVLFIPNNWFLITISVQDVNDNIPVFRQSEVVINIKESEKPSHSVPIEPAIDNDIGQFTVQSYILLGVQHTFSIQYELPLSVNLIVMSKLDYEDLNTRIYHGTLIACDGGNSSKCGQQKLIIKITDVNDNKPQFLKPNESIIISEFTKINSIIYHAKAVDIDSNSFGKLEYKFSSEIKLSTLTFFDINFNTGEIILIKSLENRNSAFIILKIIVRDESGTGPFSDEMTLKIYIQSENNHPPKISLQQLPNKIVREFAVLENSPNNTYIGLIIAEDADKFENGQVECKLIHDKIEYFFIQLSIKIKKKTIYALKTAMEIDCETVNVIAVRVECFDFGRDSRFSSLTFNIKIIDVNEYHPEFVMSNISGTVLENSPPGSFVLKIDAKDKDFTTNITYQLVNDSLFKINITTGNIYTFQHIDRETLGNVVNFTVIIYDNGHDSNLFAKTYIFIKILDINDNIPQLLNDTHISVLENQYFPFGVIYSLKGYDPDLGENGSISYAIHSVTEYNKNPFSFNNTTFKINSLTGDLSISPNFRFDYETCNKYEFKLILKDEGMPKLYNEYNIIVDVIDVNDNAPFWVFPLNSDSFHVNISGQPDLERPFFRLQVQDNDSHAQTNLTYQILYDENDKYPYDEYFIISSQYGYLYLKNPLIVGVYEIKVQASDNGNPVLKSNILKVIIHVQPNASQQFSISITMMGVTIFLVSGLTLTILLGLGYLCKTKCHFQKSLMKYSKTSELNIKEFYPQTNDSDDIELKMTTNLFQTIPSETSVENNCLSHLQIYDRYLNKLMDLSNENGAKLKKITNEKRLDLIGYTRLSDKFLASTINYKNLTNPSGMVTSSVVCHELECSSTDSGHGASDENQYNSDRANQVLKQLSPQMCCYTLLPSVSYNQCACLPPSMIGLGLESFTDNPHSFNQILSSLNPSTVSCSTCQEINISGSNNLFHITHSDYVDS